MNRSLDIHTRIPEDMADYLENNGFHFSRKAYLYAIKDIKGKKVEPYTKEDAEELFMKHSVEIEHDILYDAVYKLTKEKALHFGKSLPDEKTLVMHIKEDLDEEGSTGEEVFREWVADRIGEGSPIDWHSIL